MSSPIDRAALIARQGAGARYDAVNAPVDSLLLARRGTAYFLRILNGLQDKDLVNNRARTIARVSFQARGLARLMQGARQDALLAEHESPERLTTDTSRATSLPARALRGLFAHSAIHLDVEWRDLPSIAWDRQVTRLDGNAIAARETPMVRARTVWHAALDLDAGGRITDLPPLLRSEAAFE